MSKTLVKMNTYLDADFSKSDMILTYTKLKDVRNGRFEPRHYLFAFGGYDFKHLDS